MTLAVVRPIFTESISSRAITRPVDGFYVLRYNLDADVMQGTCC
jgi:hypothetical protein